MYRHGVTKTVWSTIIILILGVRKETDLHFLFLGAKTCASYAGKQIVTAPIPLKSLKTHVNLC